MKRRTWYWIIIAVVAVVSIVGFWYASYKIEDITFTQGQLQARINAKLPITKDEITVTRVDVTLLENAVHLHLMVEGSKFGQQFYVSAKTTGTPSYTPVRGSFHFNPSEIVIDELTIRGKSVAANVENAVDGAVKKLSGTRIGALVDRVVQPAEIAETTEVVASKIEQWVRTSLAGIAAWALERTPVYTLRDDFKGIVLRALLTGVEIHESGVTLHLSLWQLTAVVFGFLVLFCIGVLFIILMIRHPEFGRFALEGGIEAADTGLSMTDIFDAS